MPALAPQLNPALPGLSTVRACACLPCRSSPPASDGLGGCRTYDANQSPCPPTPLYPHWCVSTWCFVDPDACGEVRGAVASPLIPGLHYSYNTCGQLDRYTAFRSFDAPLRITTGVSPPYVVAPAGASAVAGWPYDGALVAFADELLKNFDSQPVLNISSGFATPESLAALGPFATPWSACVHDVAVGNFDLCAVDVWMTPERMKMCDFLPPFDTEHFRLMVLDEAATDISFAEAVGRIFLPFAAGTWAVVVTFLVGLLAFWWLVEWHSEDRPEEAASSRAVIIFFLGLMSFLTDDLAPLGEPRRAGRVVKFAVAFFLFITRSLFTANLTAVMVTEAAANKINSIDDAVDAGLVICTGHTVEGRLRQAHPGADFHPVAWEGLIARNLKTNGGPCDAAVMPATYWRNMRAGAYATMDCADDDSACQRTSTGEPDLHRDCGYVFVGEVVTTVPVSMPVRSEVAHALGWSTVDLISQGTYDALPTGKRYSKDVPKSICPAKAESTLSLPPEYLKGCVGISGILLAVGLVAHLVWPKRPAGSSFRVAAEPAKSSSVELGGKATDHADIAAMLRQIGTAHATLTAKFAAQAAAPSGQGAV